MEDETATSNTPSSGIPTTGEGPPSTCGPVCGQTWIHFGDLEIGTSHFENTEQFACLTQVTGNLDLYGLDESQLAGLRNLTSVGGSITISSEVLFSLAPLECIRDVGTKLTIFNSRSLSDLSALGSVISMPWIELRGTGISGLPTIAPGFLGINRIDLYDNEMLVDLDALETWTVAQGGGVGIYIADQPNLKSIFGLHQLIEQANGDDTIVNLENLPALQSLAGLEPFESALSARLTNLPQVSELTPLSQLRHAYYLRLSGMPLVKSLHGLDALESAGTMVLGDCWISTAGAGMDGLTSLAGLSSLVKVDKLGIAWNANITSLSGAEKLASIQDEWSAFGNPKLGPDAIQDFIDQVKKDSCEIADVNCSCDKPLPP